MRIDYHKSSYKPKMPAKPKMSKNAAKKAYTTVKSTQSKKDISNIMPFGMKMAVVREKDKKSSSYVNVFVS